jgi:hypothetical protein
MPNGTVWRFSPSPVEIPTSSQRTRSLTGANRTLGVMPAVGELVRCTDGRWMVRWLERCPLGHQLGAGPDDWQECGL